HRPACRSLDLRLGADRSDVPVAQRDIHCRSGAAFRRPVAVARAPGLGTLDTAEVRPWRNPGRARLPCPRLGRPNGWTRRGYPGHPDLRDLSAAHHRRAVPLPGRAIRHEPAFTGTYGFA